MSIFKKIGQAVKKGAKQISLKNVVKLGTPLLGSIPVVGGVAQSVVQNASEAHELKKQAKQYEAENQKAEALMLQDLARAKSAKSGALVGQQAGSLFNAFSKGATKEFTAQATQGVKEAVGGAGADAVDWTLKEWFNKHWKHLLMGVAAVVSLVFAYKKFSKPKRGAYNRKRK